MVVNNDLSERELEILKLVATGASNKEIARDLFISTNTVKVHLRNIFSKIGAVSRTEAAMYAVQAGVVAGNNSIEGGFTAPIPTTELPGRWRLILPIGIVVIIILLGFLFVQQTQPVQQTPGSDLSEAEQARWQEKAPMPTARFGLAAAVYENQIYAIGGETAQSVTGAVEKYDPQTDTWEILSPKPVPVADIQASVIGGKIYVPGGRLSDGEVLDILEIYDPGVDNWEQGARLPETLSAYALAAFEGKLYLFGGWDGKEFRNVVYSYDPQLNSWSEKTPMLIASGYLGAVVSNGKIFVVGGYDGSNVQDAMYLYSPEDDDGEHSPWQRLSPIPKGRYAMGIASVADKIYIVGGNAVYGQQIPDLEYHTLEDSWSRYDTSILNDWSSLTLVTLGSKLFAYGGVSDASPLANQVVYQPIYTILLPIVR